VSIEIARQPPPGTTESCSRSDSSSVLSRLAGGWNSPDAMFSPARIRRVAVAVSSLPDWNSIASRNAGR
jgi:hypothetical protein